MNLKMCCCIVIFSIRANNDLVGAVTKRTLTYVPPGGVVQMVMGVGLPLVVNHNSIIMGLILKHGYSLPTNSTDFTNPSVLYGKKRSISRWDIYDSLSQISENYGFGGKECVLRTVCELAAHGLDKDIGILQEIVHTIFTPSSTLNELRFHSDNIFYGAEMQGRKNKQSCQFIFPECPNHFAELFTKIS